MIDRELEAEILRLHHVEHWPIGTIAKQHRIHHSVVRRVLRQRQERALDPSRRRARMIDPYLELVREMLGKYPRITAARLYDMVRERGYPGHPTQFRKIVAQLRPARPAEAYLRLRTLPGEQAQVDWGHFGRIAIGRASRPLVAFVMVLSYSRALFVRFFLSQSLGSFLYGHEAAFGWFAGIPRTCLYDNLKTAVLERIGRNAIRFHRTFLEFATHCGFEPRPVAIARGNEKGRVERAVGFVRTRFFEGRRYRDLDHLNDQVLTWCATISLERRWPEDSRRTVGDVFTTEKERLLPLPGAPFPCDDRDEVIVGKTPYVRYDGNDYSVPHELVGRTLVVVASHDTVRILDERRVVATYARCFDRGVQIEDPAHIEALVRAKHEASQHRTTDLLTRSAPSATAILAKIAERHQPLGRAARELLDLLRTYSAMELEESIREALRNETPHTQAVRHILDRNRRAAGRRPALPLDLPDDPRVRDLLVRTHDLEDYDLDPNLPPQSNEGDPIP